MSRAHRDILHLARLLARIVEDLPLEKVDHYLVRDAQRVIEATEALVSVHTAQEEDIYAAVAEMDADVVLMDGEMPEMDGFQATVAIRARESKSGGHIKIIAMTGLTTQSDRARCLAAGMDGHLCKPVRARELFEAVEQGNVV